jgi:hypothetical protein
MAADGRRRQLASWAPLAPTPVTARGFRRRAVGPTDNEALSVRLFEKRQNRLAEVPPRGGSFKDEC